MKEVQTTLGTTMPGASRSVVRTCDVQDGSKRNVDAPALSGSLVRGARGLLGWSVADLASASGVSASTIKRLEDGIGSKTRPSRSEAVCDALQRGGVKLKVVDGTTWISL